MGTEKIHKLLAQAGLGSRREIERWIEQRRISINGKIAKIGERATTQDQIRVDGRLIRLQQRTPDTTRVLIYNKPADEVCSRRDEKGRKTVFDRLPKLTRGRWINVGRLDLTTQGLLLFTTDGELANQLTHPSNEIEREYAVRVFGDASKESLDNLRQGVMLDDGFAQFTRLRDAGGEGKNHWYHVTLREGRNREVRRLWESQGLTVSRLIRIRFANILLPRSLHLGKYAELSTQDINQLKRL